MVTLLIAMFAASHPGALAQSGAYDPRTWAFDSDARSLLPPGETSAQTAFLRQPDLQPIVREIVTFSEPQPPGTIVISTSQRRLYYVLGNGKALKYAVGVGKEGFSWSGQHHITNKRKWPDWRPPEEMRRREAWHGRVLPAFVKGGPNNPLGARALYIGDTLCRIHGTNAPWTVGQATSSGCIRMANEDVIDLYERVSMGAKVVVRH
ncbi:L,D-transpeptidase [Chelativorans salis]|uniref:L,D-transpeptidase n=1 Tax=Chelativorans salis TaxID=2978478 RepID=A0ABT2LQL1_9HYPH|nr:L,D-transpeptidase [Chelativorans sp. EGI FJ00035]MCT7376841.1 L,D-transpeptidase [Chelativorans sp. EGI FJ00035]